jgi:hypothetical protein
MYIYISYNLQYNKGVSHVLGGIPVRNERSYFS